MSNQELLDHSSLGMTGEDFLGLISSSETVMGESIPTFVVFDEIFAHSNEENELSHSHEAFSALKKRRSSLLLPTASPKPSLVLNNTTSPTNSIDEDSLSPDKNGKSIRFRNHL